MPGFYHFSLCLLHSFHLKSDVLASLPFCHFSLFLALLGVTLCQFGSNSMWISTQLSSHFPNFKFPGREIWIGTVKSSGQLAMAGEWGPTLTWGTSFKGERLCLVLLLWFHHSEVDDPFSPKSHFTELLNTVLLNLHSKGIRFSDFRAQHLTSY